MSEKKKDLLEFYEEELQSLMTQFSETKPSYTNEKKSVLVMIESIASKIDSLKRASDYYVRIPSNFHDFRFSTNLGQGLSWEDKDGKLQRIVLSDIERSNNYASDCNAFLNSELEMTRVLNQSKDGKLKVSDLLKELPKFKYI